MLNIIKYLVVPAVALVLTMKIYNWLNETLVPKAPETTEESKQEVLIGGPFSLTNQDGETVTNQDFAGKYMLVYFGFANCPMICPTDMADISQALDKLDDTQLEKVQPIFITIDPERDTVENIKTFLENFHSKFQGLTGTNEQVAAAIKEYRVYNRKVESDELQDYLMDHSSFTYLMGPDGKYVAHFSHEDGANKIAEGLKKYL